MFCQTTKIPKIILLCILFQGDTVGIPGAKKCLGNGEEEKNRKQTETALSDWFLHYEYYEVYKITCPQKIWFA